VQSPDQIRGFIVCAWSSPEGNTANIHGHAFVICTGCDWTPEQYIEIAKQQLVDYDPRQRETGEQRGTLQ
jgi:hypothetical protein